MSISKELKKGFNRILWGIPNRYGHLVREIKRSKCRTILEIGVWNGDRSVRMIKAALDNNVSPETIRYYGFDLFENADENVVSLEASKFPPSIDMVKNKLKAFSDLGIDINLYKGDTTQILPDLVSTLPIMDFVFIDGGHSYETANSDWECVKRIIGKHSVIIFDDYVNDDGINNMNFGVNKVIDNIDKKLYSISFLNPVDSFIKEWGILKIRFVKVTPKL